MGTWISDDYCYRLRGCYLESFYKFGDIYISDTSKLFSKDVLTEISLECDTIRSPTRYMRGVDLMKKGFTLVKEERKKHGLFMYELDLSPYKEGKKNSLREWMV